MAERINYDLLTADQHFGHELMIEVCNRPFKNTSIMDEQLIKNWNETIKNDDTIYVIGDLTLKTATHKGYISQIVSKLKGHKHLILGNHDSLKPFDYIDLGFTSVHTSLVIESFILNHDPSVSCINRKNSFFLCGHVHDLFLTQKNVINVGVDVWNYKPVSLEEINKLIVDRNLYNL